MVLRLSLLALLPANLPSPWLQDQHSSDLSKPPPGMSVPRSAVIDDISLHVSRRELLLVMGLPGSGKSSLLHAILQQRQLLLLSGCSFIRAALCLHFPEDEKKSTSASAERSNSRSSSAEKEGVQQQKRHQDECPLTQGEQRLDARTTDSLEERKRLKPGMQPGLKCSPMSSDAEIEDTESEGEEEVPELLTHAGSDSAVPIGYVSQEPWLQVGTVRENITFGCAVDESLYEEVVTALDLHQDFRSWAGGDNRFIDEGGTDLSGGQRMRIAMARAVYVCLAYRRKAAAHAATVRQQLRLRERQLEQNLKAVAALAQTPERTAEILQQQWHAERHIYREQQHQRRKEGERASAEGVDRAERQYPLAAAFRETNDTRESSSGKQEAFTPQETKEYTTAVKGRSSAARAMNVLGSYPADTKIHEAQQTPQTAKTVREEKHPKEESVDADIEALPYLFCFDETFSSLDPGVAERVFRNLFGSWGLLRNAAVVLASSEQSLFTLLNNVYSEGEDEHIKQQVKKSREQQTFHVEHGETSRQEGSEEHRTMKAETPTDEGLKRSAHEEHEGRSQGRGTTAETANGELFDRATFSAAKQVLFVESGEPAQPRTADHSTAGLSATAADVAKEASETGPATVSGRAGQSSEMSGLQEHAHKRMEEGGRGGARSPNGVSAAGSSGRARMHMSVCCIDRGRVTWKGSVEEFRQRSKVGLQQLSQKATTAQQAVNLPHEQAAADKKKGLMSTEPLGKKSALFSPTHADTVAVAPSAAATASSTVESVLSFLPARSQDETEIVSVQENQQQAAERQKHAAGKKEADELLKNMMVHEQAASGQVGWPSYMWYLRATGIFLSLLFVCLLLLTAFTDFVSDVWIAQWTGLSPSARRTRAAKNVGTRKESPNVEGPVGLLGEERKMREAETQAAGALAVQREVHEHKKPFPRPTEDAHATHALYLWFYVGLASANIFLELLIKLLETRGSLQAAERIHDILLHVICNAPLWFYDQNPIGRIVNRLSTDVAVLDSGIFKRMGLALTAFFSCLFALLVLGITTIWTLPLLPFLLLGVYFLVFRYYRSTCREVQRASLISFSPLCSSFSECLSGREVIFALRRENVFALRNLKQVELAQRAKLMHWAVSAWASIRLQLLSFPLALVNAVGPRIVAQHQLHVEEGGARKDFFSIVRHPKQIRQQRLGYLGLAVSYSLSIASALRRMMHHFTHLEKEMCSLERIHEFATETEPPTLRPLAELPGPLGAIAAKGRQQEIMEVAAALREKREAAAVEEARLKRTEVGVSVAHLEADQVAALTEDAGAVGPVRKGRAQEGLTLRDELQEGKLKETPGAALVGTSAEGEEDESIPVSSSRRGVVLEGVEVRYRRAGFQYVSRLRAAVEVALQHVRSEKARQQKIQRQQKQHEHRVIPAADETLALLLHAPKTTAVDEDEIQTEEQRLLMILDGIGEGEQAVFLFPSLYIDYAAAGPTEHIGVVGRTGSGKTTLLQTLSGVLRCSRGSIKIDGMDISLFPPELLREIIGVLPQRPIVFSGMTVRDVVDPRGRHDDEAVWRALDRVGISHLIRGLASSHQLYTPVHPTDAAAQQLPAEAHNTSLSSAGSAERSFSRSSSSALMTTWDREKTFQCGEESGYLEGLVEQERHQTSRCDSTSTVYSRALTNCQLRYLALARLILHAPTFRLLLVDEPPADALDETYGGSRTTVAAFEEKRIDAAAHATAPPADDPAAACTRLHSSSSVAPLERHGDTEQQISQRGSLGDATGEFAGTGRRKQHQNLLFTPIPELLKQLFGHCTVFIVAHHVDSLQACDTVWLLWRGRIIGQCEPTDIRTDRQLAEITKRAVRAWKSGRKGAAGRTL